MGSRSPGRYRKEGREAYEPDGDPDHCCPYKSAWGHRDDWMEGWKQGEAQYEADQADIAEEDAEWDAMSGVCPWNSVDCGDGDACSANNDGCNKENCAPWYFKHN